MGMFLGNYPIDDHAVQKLKSLNPYQQKAVLSRGSLAGARDPTAVLLSRCKKAMEGAMTISTTVLVRGFDYSTTDDQLATHMSAVGTVQFVNRTTEKAADVTYGSVDEALSAIQSLTGSTIIGQQRYIDVLPHDANQAPGQSQAKGGGKTGGQDNTQMMMQMMNMMMQMMSSMGGNSEAAP